MNALEIAITDSIKEFRSNKPTYNDIEIIKYIGITDYSEFVVLDQYDNELLKYDYVGIIVKYSPYHEHDFSKIFENNNDEYILVKSFIIDDWEIKFSRFYGDSSSLRCNNKIVYLPNLIKFNLIKDNLQDCLKRLFELLNSIDAYKQIVLDLETKIENLTSEKEYYENKWRTLKDIFADLTN